MTPRQKYHDRSTPGPISDLGHGVLSVLDAAPTANEHALTQKLGCSLLAARTTLDRLVSRGALVRTGDGVETRYSLTDDARGRLERWRARKHVPTQASDLLTTRDAQAVADAVARMRADRLEAQGVRP